jgi:hypothetical protein
MQSFLTKFAGVVRGVLSGLDRLFLRGSMRGLSYTQGFRNFLSTNGILLKDFGDYSQQVTGQLAHAIMWRGEIAGCLTCRRQPRLGHINVWATFGRM